jgi:hypothetical protein
MLALMGYVPGSAKKTNPEIFEAFSSSPEKMVVGFTTDNGFMLERGFVKKGDSVNQGYKVNGARAAKEFYHETIGKSGGIKAVDVGAFMGLSDQKQIDMILDLYPPAEDIGGLITAANNGKAKILDAEAKARAKEDAAAELIASKAALNLPAGTLAEIAGEIIRADAQLDIATENLKKATAEAAAADAKEKAEARAKVDAEAAKKKADEALKKQAETIKAHEEKAKSLERPAELPSQPAAKVEPGPTSGAESAAETAKTGNEKPIEAAYVLKMVVVESFKSILQAFKDADCGACTARLVVLRELKKFKKEG